MQLPRTAGEPRPAGAPDGEIVARVRSGEVALFEVLMRRHNQQVYRAIRSIVRDEAEVEDAMQQAWLRAYANLHRFEGAAAFSTWLTRIAVNEALDRLRRRRRTVLAEDPSEELEDPAAPRPPSPEEGVAARESLSLLEAAVDHLPPNYRSVYVLRDVQELSTAECAAALGVTEETVKVRLHRARAALRGALAEPLGRAPAFTFLGARCDRIVAAVMGRILAQHAPPPAHHP